MQAAPRRLRLTQVLEAVGAQSTWYRRESAASLVPTGVSAFSQVRIGYRMPSQLGLLERFHGTLKQEEVNRRK